MSDAGGTDRRININASGALQIDSTPVGGSTAFSLPGFTQSGLADSDIVYASVLIPANTFGIGDILELRSLVERTDLTGAAYEAYMISTAAQTVGTPVNPGVFYQLAGIQSSSNGSAYYQKTLWISAAGTAAWKYGFPNETNAEQVTGGDPSETQPINWSVDQYLYYQLWQDSTTGSLQNFGTLIRKIN